MKKTQVLFVFCTLFFLFFAECYAFASKEKSGKTVYGFCIYDDSWGASKPLGLYSFNTANPSVITRVWNTNLSVNAAAYYDRYYYAVTSVHNGAAYLSMDFGKFDANTGEYTKIADWSQKLPQIIDMTMDYSTDQPRLVGLKVMSVGEWRLVEIDMLTGDLKYISNNNSIGSFFGLACGHDGTFYAINNWTSGTNLVTIDRTSGRLNDVGTVSITPKFLQSMDFDPTDGTLYWASTTDDFNGKFGTLDPVTGKYTVIGTLGNNAEFVGLHIPVSVGESGTPTAPTAFKVIPAENGIKTANIEWKVPTLDNSGATLTSVTSVKLYRNNQLIQTFSNPTVGSTGTFTDNVSNNGIYFYKITAENNVGISVVAQSRVFIGEDKPMGPTNIVLSRNEQKGILSWTPPTKGINGGWINTSKLKYKINRRQGFNIEYDIATNETGSTFTDNNVPEKGSYIYTVYASTDVGTGYEGESNPFYIGASLTMPYNCNFTEKQWNLWTVVDANKDKIGWRYYNNDEDIVYSTASKDNASDDYLISPPITLGVGSYKLSFDYKAKGISIFEKMKVFYGQGEIAEAQTNLLLSIDNFNNINFNKATAVIVITTPGDYNFSFYACSDANRYGMQVANVKLEDMVANDLEATLIKGDFIPVVNTENVYKVAIKNSGSATQNSYTVQMIDDKNNVLSSVDVNESIAVNQTKDVSMNWTPTETGQMKIRGKVVLTGDQNASNNISNPIQIEIQPEGYNVLTVGNATREIGGIPFDLTYRTSTQQMIYLKDDIGSNGGMITKIIYPYNIIGNSTFSTPKKMRVYLANTEQSSLEGGWMPDYEFTKVFDANVQLLAGEGYLILTLSKPYLYSGQNLCVMFTRAYDNDVFHNLRFYVSETATNRTMIYGSYTDEFNGNQNGTLKSILPNMLLQFDANKAGMISGVVKCDGVPIEGVRININSLAINTTTDASGYYYFGYVPAGTYSMTTIKHGYASNTVMGIVVNENIETTNDITIQKLPVYPVSGNVKDVDNNNIAGAVVSITGYESYSTDTDANGNFTIPNVYRANGYSIRIKGMGVEPYNGSFNVVNTAVDLGTMILKDIVKAPTNIETTLSDSGMNVTWEAPLPTTTFRYDDGLAAGYRGFPEGTDKSVLGTVHRVPAILESMSWYTGGASNYGGPHETINIFVFDLDEQGAPTNNILFNKMSVPNVDDTWSSFKFTERVNCPNGFMLAVSYAGYVGIARDAGTSLEWPFVPQTSYNCSDYTTERFFYEGGTKTFSYMIRAEGYNMSRFDTKSDEPHYTKCRTFGYIDPVQSRMSLVSDVNGELINTEESTLSMMPSRSINGYKVWRLKAGEEESQSKWTLLTADKITSTKYEDTEWQSLSRGSYKYAVKTVYTNATSEPAFSLTIPKDVYNNVTVNVITNTPINESQGAVVKLTNKDNNPEHIYFATIDGTGKAIINNIWKGIYTVNVYIYGFEKLEENNVPLEDGVLVLNYELREILNNPSNLEIVKTDTESERIFKWSGLPINNLYDDFERHPDFKINSTSNCNWSYIDGDKAETTGIESVTFPNQGSPMAYIIFNPSKAQPALVDEAIAPYQGEKYQATFAVYAQPNQDYIVSPELSFPVDFTISFWAKSYISTYGLERFKVGYSLTGNAQADFNNWVTTGSYQQVPTKWTKYSYTIPKEARYVAVECVSNDAFIFMFDDVFIGIESSKSLSKYEVYLDGNKLDETSDKTYMFTDLKEGKHNAGVKAVYTSGTSGMSTKEFEVGHTSVETMENVSLRLYPNPVQDVLNINGDYKTLRVFNEVSKLVKTANGEPQIDLGGLPSGIYFIECVTDNGNTEVHRIIKK